ncbi:glycosyltransferase family 2 protein [Aquisphaera insulae]|uniref:glycosyltransferase family 2 protein n=1 Tax=Aquisphaera insulae TaxID=2712864 RepID=UPI0013EC7C4A|nr:glycosyltransferase family 2 protein [Aquisphaera insulae]
MVSRSSIGPGHAPDEDRGDATPVPLCSLVIPSFNGRKLLETCLASVFRHLPAGNAWTVEVIVSDDASTDGTAEWLAAAHPTVRLLRREANGGFCAAANAGIEAARGHFIQLLNNDTEVTAGWLEAGLAPFADPTVGSVAPLVLVRSEPDRVDSAGDTYTLAGWPAKRGHGQAALRWGGRPPEEVFAASGSSAFYRASALRHVGGFDPLLGSYYEDVDLGFRLRWAGYRCMFNPRCRILHEISATYDHGRPALQRRMARNAELVFWSNMPRARLAAAIIPHALLLTLQACWRLSRLRFLPFFLGKLDAARSVTSIRDRRKLRADLSRSAINPAHFPMGVGPFASLIDHLQRPREASARHEAAERPRRPRSVQR